MPGSPIGFLSIRVAAVVPEVSSQQSRSMNRLLGFASFLVIFAVSLTGCRDKERDRQAWRLATRRLIDAYADAAKRAVSDCGSNHIATATYPEVFFYNPGWNNWTGPYLQGKPRSLDYFDTPIQYVVRTNELR